MKSYLAGDSRSRRTFLKFSVLLGINTAASLIPAGEAGAFLFGKKEHKVSKTKLVMGTYVSVTAIHRVKDQAEEAIALAFEEIYRLNSLLSRHIDVSPISQLNTHGFLNNAPVELVDVVRLSLAYHQLSRGAFDISVLPLLLLYESRFSQNKIPTNTEIDERLELVGADDIKVDGRTIRLSKKGMGITTDGIAKGYIVDRASDILRQNGIENHLINAGGDIKTHGHAMKKKPWTIAIQDPSKGGEYPEILKMGSGAVATSGNYEIYFDEAKLFHHIVDPISGRSPLLSKSVTVTAPTVTAADALATSVFVLQPNEGTNLADSHDSFQSLIVDKKDEVIRSKDWKSN